MEAPRFRWQPARMSSPRTQLPPVPAEALRLIECVRDARFAHGRICPHCSGTHVVLWGSFRSRRRYRCRTCDRTFSDLTATPYSYSKKPELWPAYQDGMRRCRKLRQAAADVGIHLCTSFRWRHAILRRLPHAGSDLLTGWTEITQLSMAYSNKGMRMRGAGRTRGSGTYGAEWQRTAHVHLLVAQARTGTRAAAVMAYDGLSAADIRTVLKPHPAARWLLRTTFSPPWRQAFSTIPHVTVDHRTTEHEYHLRNAIALRNRLVVWLEQFRGVATRYLRNYLSWFRLVDLEIAGVWSRCVTLQCSGGTPFS